MREKGKRSIGTMEWSDHLSHIEESLMFPQVTATKWSSAIGNTFQSGRKKKSLNNGRINIRWPRTLDIS
jgi:hypothetical protein